MTAPMNFEEYVPTVIRDRPDPNSSEAILYGSKYLVHKSADWWYDMLLNELDRQIEQKKLKVRDKEFAAFVLTSRPGMIFANSPPVSNFDQLKDLRALRDCVKTASARKLVERDRAEMEMYCRMHGTDEFIRRKMQDGITEGEWKAATASRNPPIDFDAVRAIYDDDAEASVPIAEQLDEDLARYREEQQAFEREMQRYRDAVENGEEFRPEEVFDEDGNPIGAHGIRSKVPDGMEPGIAIYRDAVKSYMDDMDRKEGKNPNSDDFWNDGQEGDGERQEGQGRAYTPDWLTGAKRDRAIGVLSGLTDPVHALHSVMKAMEGSA